MRKIKTKTGTAISAGILGAAGLGLAVAIPLVSHADSASINFESPNYSIGNINGQDGWSKTGPYDVAVVANTYGYASFGAQSLRTSDAVTSGSFGDQTFSKPLVNEAGETDALNGGFSSGTRQPHFEAQFDLASVLSTVQTGMHVSVSPDRGDGARMSYLRFEDHSSSDIYTADTADATHLAGTHYTDGIHVYFDDVEGTNVGFQVANFVETDIGTLSRSPHTIKFSMDFLDGPNNDVVKIYIDGVLKHTGTSWENYYRFDTESQPDSSYINKSRTVDSLLFRESGDAHPADANNGFLIDNLSLLSGPIPSNSPANTDQCKNNGWNAFTSPTFKNQGDCVSWVQHNVNLNGTPAINKPSH